MNSHDADGVQTRKRTARWGPELVALACIALQMLIVFRAPQGVASDQLFQLTAVHQFMGGQSSSINRLVTIDEADLTRNVANWIDFWPPGFPVMAYAGAAVGLADGTSSRMISLLGASVGVMLWLAWSRRLGAGPRSLYAIAALVPWTRHVSAMSLETSGEALLFAFAPGLLLLADRVRMTGDKRHGLALGLLGGAAFLCKYSAGVTFAAVLAAAWLSSRLPRERLLAPAGIALATFTIIVATWTMASSIVGSGLGNSALDTMQLREGWALNPLIAAANVGLSIADLGAPLSQATQALGIRVLVGLGLLLSAVALIGARQLREHGFTIAFVATTAILLAAIWTFSGAADYNHRHAMQAGLALLPLMAMRLDQQPTRSWRIALLAALMLASTAYGSASLVAKVSRNAADSEAADRLWGQFLTWRGAQGVRDAASESCEGAPPIWFVVDRLSALRLGGRRMGMGAEFWSLERLRLRRREPAQYCVVMLLPDAMDVDGRGDVLRKSFKLVQQWNRLTVEGSTFPLWIGRSTADAAPRP